MPFAAANPARLLFITYIKGVNYIVAWLRPKGGSDLIMDGTISLAQQQLFTLFDFSIWARDRLLAVIETLDENLLRRAPESGAYGSMHDTLAHMAVSEWMWVQRCEGQSPMRLPRGEDFVNLEVLVGWWNDAHANAIAFIETLDDAGLMQERTYMGPDGKKRTRKIWHMLLQVVNHQTEHRAQIASMLGQMGLDVPQTDLVVYLSEKAV